MNTSIKIALVVVAVIVLLSLGSAVLKERSTTSPPISEVYTSAISTLQCENGATLTVQYSADASKALLSASGVQHKLVREMSGSGTRYIGETEAIVYAEHQGEATITWPGQPEGFTCVVAGTQTETENESPVGINNDLIVVTSPSLGEQVGNPIVLEGMARGYWFFEASAPVVVTNWNGLIIGEGYVTAEGEWMTEDIVPFSGTLSYEIPENNYSATGTLIFMRDNPSGLPENDMAYEMTIMLQE